MAFELQALLTWAQVALGHAFRSPEVLQEALTHTTYANEHPKASSNQRLEFLGDAVVGLTMAEHLFHQFPQLPEGDLTKIRAAVVCEPALAARARALELGSQLRFGRGEAVAGRDRDSTLADAFEAIVGALYMDAGWDAARALVVRELSPLVSQAFQGTARSDFKTRLQESLQRGQGDPPTYRLLEEDGPAHGRRFFVGVYHKGRQLGTGWGRSKKEAEQEAARVALDSLPL